MINSDTGTYVVFEGVDFCGKTTLAKNVHQNLCRVEERKVLLTKHPGATPLGQHLRQLVKNTELIDPAIKIDGMSAQVLMMVDQISFISTILTPELDSGTTVLADRSNFISAMAYGLPEGVSPAQLNKLFQLVESPSPDRIYILRAPWEVIDERRRQRADGPDRFEDNGDDYLQSVAEIYSTLKVNPHLLVLLSDYVQIENIVYLDATEAPEVLAARVSKEIIELANAKASAWASNGEVS